MPKSRRLAAIMFTDLVGYTSLMGSDEEGAFKILHQNRNLHKSLITRYNGTWLKEMGDGILVRFPAASDAVFCAAAIMEQARKLDIKLRIGIHMGEVVEEDGDIFGDGVNIASRIESAAETGQILVSDSIARNVRNREGVECIFKGEESLKNVSGNVRLYSLFVAPGAIPEHSRPPFSFKDHPWKIAAGMVVVAVVAGIFLYSLASSGRPFSFVPSSTVIDPGIEKSVAVLPFTNLSPDPDDRYLSEGIAEDIRSHLSLVPGLSLISRTSVNRYRNTEKDIPAIAGELGAGYILEGSVQKGADMVRITVRLIDSERDEELWAESYNRPLTGILEVQSDISQRIASELRTNFVTNVNYSTDLNHEAYHYYLKARHLWQAGDPNYFPEAIRHYERALTLEPNFALAYAGLADLYLNLAHIGRQSHEVFPISIAAAEKALEINNTLAEAHTAYADCMYHYKYEWEEAEDRFQLALEINPSYSPALWWYSGMLSAQGRHGRAIEQIEKALRLDPLNVAMLGWSAKSYFWAGDTLEAAKRFEQVRNLLPEETIMIPYLWLEYYQSSRSADLIPVLERNIPKFGFNIPAKTALALAYIDHGEREKAVNIAREMASGTLTQPHFLALIYTQLGENERAFQYLEEAYEKRDAALIWINVNPGFAPLRQDKRFKALLGKMNLAPARL